MGFWRFSKWLSLNASRQVGRWHIGHGRRAEAIDYQHSMNKVHGGMHGRSASDIVIPSRPGWAERRLTASRLELKIADICPVSNRPFHILASPNKPSRTMRILSSAEYCRRGARRMSFTTPLGGRLRKWGFLANRCPFVGMMSQKSSIIQVS